MKARRSPAAAVAAGAAPTAPSTVSDAAPAAGPTQDEIGRVEAAGPVDGADGTDDEEAGERRSMRVEAAGHAQRLDRLLVDLAPEFSRSHLQQLIQRGRVTVDERVATTASARLRAGQSLTVLLEPTQAGQAFRPEAQAMAPVVYEDDALLVIDKPAGLVVHPGAGHWSGTLLNGLLAHHAGAADLPRAGIVHRLDKDTSGLMVVAKTLPAMTALVRAIAAREVDRRYLALAHGQWPSRVRRIDAPIGRHPQQRVRMAVIADGRPARTEVEPLGVADSGQGRVSALALKLHTGRTHQIRVHAAQQGHPLLADALYGGRRMAGLERQALHAQRLGFAHPEDGRPMAFESPLPADLAQAWASLGLRLP